MAKFKSCLKMGAALTVAVPVGLASWIALAAHVDTTTLPNGADLSVQIDDPLDEQEFKIPAASGPGGTIDVPVDGEASVGQGTPNIHVTFVMDVSGSTNNVNIVCLGGFVLDCEKQAVVNVINDPNFSSVLDTGVTVFATSAASADMSGIAGDQPLTSVFADAITVANSAFSVFGGPDGGVTQFTNKLVGFETNFTAGLQAANNSVSASGAGTKRVFFVSDGLDSGLSNLIAFDAAVATLGVRIDSFAIGASAACGSGAGVDLQRMADLSGGSCTPLPDPADIVTALPDLIATSLDSIQVAVDGGNVATNTSIVLPADGPVTADYDALPNRGVGDYNITATAEGSDNAGSDTVVANVDVHLLQLAADPANAVNELSADTEHTVNARILGGTGPDRNIDFAVIAGPHSGAAGSSLATPGGADVSFQYVAVANECSSLGTDTINVSTTIAGMLDNVILTKDWVDTIAPVATCEPTENPHGNNKPNAPGNGGQGQNQDGFYIVEATDNLSGASCDPLDIFILDDGSGTVFGPFGVGTEIKYTQDEDATPVQKKIGGSGNNSSATDTDWHIIGNGDAVVTAVDGAGNVSVGVSCLVPPPPK